MIANKEVKRTFKVLLDSDRTNSYNGTQFNANYYIDLKQIITDDSAYDKSYYMYCTFRSRSDTIANNGINSNNIYSLHIDMGRGINVYQYNHSKNVSFLVPVSVSNETATPQTYFNLTDDLAQPVFLQNIRNMNFITLNLINNSNNTTFTGSGVDANLRYVCMLTFVEA
jgi:hypothetical protein